MGTYKVIQDIEAEDKLLGPLSLRQFIYAVVVIILGFIAFQIGKLGGVATAVSLLLFFPPMLFFGLLAAPLGKEQPSEVWLLAKIRFFLKPRKRVWDQSGMSQLVTITAPKKVERHLTKNLSQTEVKSRLEALANTIDSRGWAVKNVNVNLFAQPSYVLGQTDSDRLIDPSSMGSEVNNVNVTAADDMLDEHNTRAQTLEQMIAQSAQTHRQQVAQQMTQPQQNQARPDYWFLNQAPQTPAQPGMATFDKSQMVQPEENQQQAPAKPSQPSIDEQAFLNKVHKDKAQKKHQNSHLKTLKPIGEEPAPPKPAPNPAVSQYSTNNDLNIETISRQANKPPKEEKGDDGEVTISLH